MSNTVYTWLTKYYLIHGDKPALLHHQLCQIAPVHIPLSSLPPTSVNASDYIPVVALLFLSQPP